MFKEKSRRQTSTFHQLFVRQEDTPIEQFLRRHSAPFSFHVYRWNIKALSSNKAVLVDKLTLRRLQKEKNFYIIFDIFYEGFKIGILNWPEVVYKTIDLYNIPHKRVIFTSSNFKDRENLHNYIKKKKLPAINVFSLIDMWEVPDRDTNIKESIYETYNNLDRVYLSLAATARPHRTYSQFDLFKKGLDQYGLKSHAPVEEAYLDKMKKEIQDPAFTKWSKKTPYWADKIGKFKGYLNFKANRNLYSRVLFEIVAETQFEDKTSLFYSEKILKPILNFTPFVIYSQQYANEKMQDLFHFKLYKDYFNYDFEKEPTYQERWDRFIFDHKNLIEDLAYTNRKDQIAWKFQDKVALEHNYWMVHKDYHGKAIMKDMINTL